MKNKLINRIISTTCALVCCLSVFAVPASGLTADAAPQAATEEEIVSPNAEILEWVYAEAGGKIYKRLFNCSTGQWAGDWIYVRDAD